MITDFVRKVGGYIVMGVGVIAGLFFLFLSGKRKGELQTELKVEKEKAANEKARSDAEHEKTVEVVRNKNEAASSVSNASDDDVSRRLRDDWSD